MVTAGSCVLRLSALAAASAAASATDAGARLTGLGAGAAFPESRLITPAQGMLLNGWSNQTAGQRWELCYTSFAKMTKSVEEFHGSCDEYQLTVTVARNSLNRTFGGFVRAFLPPSSLSSKLELRVPYVLCDAGGCVVELLRTGPPTRPHRVLLRRHVRLLHLQPGAGGARALPPDRREHRLPERQPVLVAELGLPRSLSGEHWGARGQWLLRSGRNLRREPQSGLWRRLG
jgi:hypothetical protein